MSVREIQRLLEASQSAQRRGDDGAAQRALEDALELDPANSHALNSLGVRALGLARYAEALAFFKRAAEADPKEASLWVNAAKAQRLQGDDEGERASLDAALAIDARHFMALLRKAELLERLNERGAAAQAWGGVVQLAAAASDLPASITEAVRHGRTYVAEHGRALAAAVDAELAETRARYSASEKRRFEACVDAALSKRRIFRNQCHGIEFPFLPADEFFAREHFPWLPELEAKTAAIRDEFRALVESEADSLRPYVAQTAGTPTNIWTPLDSSLDWGAMFLEEYGLRDEALCARCPQTDAALDAIPRAAMPHRAPTVFFSLLRPRTRIPPHTGVTNLRAIVHLPLIVPEGCGFRVGGETRLWREGEAFVFDDTIEHEAWNDSDELRAVLIFDVWNPHLTGVERSLIAEYLAAADASGLAPPVERL